MTLYYEWLYCKLLLSYIAIAKSAGLTLNSYRSNYELHIIMIMHAFMINYISIATLHDVFQLYINSVYVLKHVYNYSYDYIGTLIT